MKLVIEIDEDIRIAISRMGLLRIPDEMQKKVDKAIQHGTPIKQEPKKDGDCISREWLKTAIHNFYQGLVHTPTEEDIQAYIDVAPSVTPAPKMGRWIYDDDVLSYEGHFGAYTCSCCNKAFLDDLCMNNGSDEINVGNEFKYCPFCGAKLSEIPTGSEIESSSEKPNKLDQEPKTEKELKQQLFKLMYELDKASVREDYDALRRLHYSGIRWVSDNDLLWEYYKYFSNRSESEGEE